MAKGRFRGTSTWDKWSRRLQEERCRFRMFLDKKTPFIQVRHLFKGKVLRQFSSRKFRYRSDEDIELCARACLKADRLGSWEAAIGPLDEGGSLHDWSSLMDAFWEQYSSRVKRAASQADHRSYCRQVQKFEGDVSVERLEEWINQTDPYVNFKKHTKQLQFLRDLRKYGYFSGDDYDEMLNEQKKRKPTQQERSRVVDREKPRAIANDEEVFEWLLSISSPLHRWAFAMVAAYGLRPSELWHLQGINEDGFVLVPGKPLCKTTMHPARATPIDWVETFSLRENFEEFHAELTSTYKIKWDKDVTGRSIPLNNSQVADAGLAQQLCRGNVPPLMGSSWEMGPGSDVKETCSPYDLRHAYAIRLWTHAETRHLPMGKHAYWMGHSLQQHKDVYLKWMPAELMMAAEVEAFEASARQQDQERPVDTASAADLQKMLDKIEKLEKQNEKQRKMIDALQDEE